MSDEAKIETRWSSTTEDRTAAAIYATGDPTGEGIPWAKADDSTRYVYVARARSALAALADAGLLALSAPSEPAAKISPEQTCHRCGGPNIVWNAPSPLWNAVMRGGSINGDDEFDGIVCPLCFAVLADERGITVGRWRLFSEYVLADLETVTPSGRVWDEHTWLWRDPETAPAAPSGPVPDGPRVWAMPDLPEDVSAVRDAEGRIWRPIPGGALRSRDTDSEYYRTRFIWELLVLGPLTEVVEEATP